LLFIVFGFRPNLLVVAPLVVFVRSKKPATLL
jgi:hypothetical protein